VGGTGDLDTKFFLHENDLIFPKTLRHFNGLHFLRRALDTAFLWGEPWVAHFVPNLPLIKWREAYWCYFSVLVFLLPSLPGNFSADVLGCVYNNGITCFTVYSSKSFQATAFKIIWFLSLTAITSILTWVTIAFVYICLTTETSISMWTPASN